MLWALVMAGGHGTRLWPLSTPKKPKPFLNLIPGRKTLLEETVIRIKPVVPESRVFLIGSAEHLHLLKKFGKKIPTKQVIGEPVKKNTAAPVILAASLIAQKDPEGILIVLPADHWIEDSFVFHQAVKKAVRVSKKEKFSIFGVKAAFPSSSYGYLRAAEEISTDVYHLKRFVEKPALEKARDFLQSGRYFWHAGIFMAPARLILDSAPALARNVQKLKIKNNKIESKEFSKLPDISFDCAVLEKLKDAYIVYSDCGWTDAGSWDSLADLWARNQHFNREFIERLVS